MQQQQQLYLQHYLYSTALLILISITYIAAIPSAMLLNAAAAILTYTYSILTFTAYLYLQYYLY